MIHRRHRRALLAQYLKKKKKKDEEQKNKLYLKIKCTYKINAYDNTLLRKHWQQEECKYLVRPDKPARFHERKIIDGIL